MIFGGVLLLLFLPPLFAGADLRMMAQLYRQTLLLAATFLALGLAAGYFANVSAWLLLLFGADLLALFAARWSGIQKFPDLWVTLLMLNPLDSFRIDALFALQQIPAEAANKTPLAGWWIAHARTWFALIAVAWSAAMIMLASLRVKRWEE